MSGRGRNAMRLKTLLVCAVLLSGCDEKTDKPTPEAPASAGAAPSTSASATTSPTGPKALDAAVIEKATGIKPEVADAVLKVSYPRTEVKVEVDGFSMPPFMG